MKPMCYRHLYWSEATKPSRIKMWGPDDNKQDIVKQDGDEVYQVKEVRMSRM